jgi:hypothetical protein
MWTHAGGLNLGATSANVTAPAVVTYLQARLAAEKRRTADVDQQHLLAFFCRKCLVLLKPAREGAQIQVFPCMSWNNLKYWNSVLLWSVDYHACRIDGRYRSSGLGSYGPDATWNGTYSVIVMSTSLYDSRRLVGMYESRSDGGVSRSFANSTNTGPSAYFRSTDACEDSGIDVSLAWFDKRVYDPRATCIQGFDPGLDVMAFSRDGRVCFIGHTQFGFVFDVVSGVSATERLAACKSTSLRMVDYEERLAKVVVRLLRSQATFGDMTRDSVPRQDVYDRAENSVKAQQSELADLVRESLQTTTMCGTDPTLRVIAYNRVCLDSGDMIRTPRDLFKVGLYQSLEVAWDKVTPGTRSAEPACTHGPDRKRSFSFGHDSNSEPAHAKRRGVVDSS